MFLERGLFQRRIKPRINPLIADIRGKNNLYLTTDVLFCFLRRRNGVRPALGPPFSDRAEFGFRSRRA